MRELGGGAGAGASSGQTRTARPIPGRSLPRREFSPMDRLQQVAREGKQVAGGMTPDALALGEMAERAQQALPGALSAGVPALEQFQRAQAGAEGLTAPIRRLPSPLEAGGAVGRAGQSALDQALEELELRAAAGGRAARGVGRLAGRGAQAAGGAVRRLLPG